MFSKFMDGATVQELKERAIEECNKIIDIVAQLPFLDDGHILLILATAAQIGVNNKTSLSPEEETMIREVFSSIGDDNADVDTDEIIDIIKEPIMDNYEELFLLLSKLSQALAMAIGNFILCFAQADGVCEEVVSQRVQMIVSAAGNIFMGSPADLF